MPESGPIGGMTIHGQNFRAGERPQQVESERCCSGDSNPLRRMRQSTLLRVAFVAIVGIVRTWGNHYLKTSRILGNPHESSGN
jgi:hypothetical protein